MSSRTVVVVDDDPFVRKSHALQLRRAGHRVVELSHARDLAEVVLRENAEVVLLDLSLPGPSGVDACAALKGDARLAGRRVFIVSGHSSFEAVRRATDAGADGFAVKPVNPEKLLAFAR